MIRIAFMLAISVAGLVWLGMTARCDARDVNTINGAKLCSANTSVHNKGE